MKNIIMTICAVAAFASCTIVRVDTKALKAIMEKEGVVFNGDVEIGKAISAQGAAVTETRNGIGAFNSISSNIPVDIEFTQGEQSVQLYAAANIMPYITTTVKDSTLYLKFEGARIRNCKDINAVISCPDIRDIEVNGAGDLSMLGHIMTEVLSVSVNGAGDVDIEDVEAKSLTISVNGAGDIEIEKIVCDSFETGISGAGDLEVDSIEAKDLSVSLAGAGSCKLAGHAVNADLSVSGAGTIDIEDLKVDNQKSTTHGIAKIIK